MYLIRIGKCTLKFKKKLKIHSSYLHIKYAPAHQSTSINVHKMEMVTYKDPLLDTFPRSDYRKFGEILCNKGGSFIYRCDFCPNKTTHINDVEQHLLTHFKDIFQAKNETLTDKFDEFKTADEYRHELSTKKKSSKQAFTEPNFTEKNLFDISSPLECDTCGWKTENRKELTKHMRTHKNMTKAENELLLVPSKTEPKIEISEIDPSVPLLPQKPKRKKSTRPVIHCQLCDKEFHSKTYLRKHVENHSFYPAMFECDICGKRVKERKDFIEHMRRAHIGIKFPCKVCGKEFAQSSYVLIHMRMHNQDRGHQCSVCGKTFFSAGALTSHMRKHNNTLNVLPCNICGKIFHLPGALRDHLRVHSGEKPFKCELCPTWFRTKKFLNQHKFVHLEVKQFACEICGMKFKQASGKRVHKRKVHGKLVGTDKRCKVFFDKVIT